MAHRTTRNKLRYQGQRILDDIDSIFMHLRMIDALAENQSDYINNKLPNLVEITEGYKKMMIQFREGL